MEALLAAASIGLGAGFSPGPLLTLVVTATLERGLGAGLRVAVAPLVTDLPIIVLALLAVRAVPDRAVDLLTLVGGAFVAYLGIETLRGCRSASLPDLADAPRADHRDLWRGALVNVLSPHPWIAWLTVLGPMTVDLGRRSVPHAVLFLIVFYSGLVGAKVVIAVVTARGRQHLDPRWYRRVLATCGLLLLGLGIILLVHGALALVAGTR